MCAGLSLLGLKNLQKFLLGLARFWQYKRKKPNDMDTNKTLRSLLAHYIVRFTFRKVDGTIRNAVGTRNLALAQAYLQTKPETRGFVIPTPKGEEQPYSYYDIEKNEWRSYKPENLIRIDGFVELPNPVRTIPVEKPVSTPTPTEKPVSTPTGKGGEMPLGGGFGFGGFGGGLPLGGGVGGGKGEPVKGGNGTPVVGIPTFTEDGLALPVGGAVSIEDFAKLVAKYVVDLLAYRLNK